MYKTIHSKRTQHAISQERKFIIGYVLAGYKDETQFFETLTICEEHHVDILEIGYPSLHPYADGSVISDAHKAVNFEKATSLEYWKQIRAHTDKPIWVMAYHEDFIASDVYKDFAKYRLVDALVIPDADHQTRLRLQQEVKESGIDIIGFANPHMDEDELSTVLSQFPLVYEQLYVGQTGTEQKEAMYQQMLGFTLEKYPHVICFGGFGLNTPQKIQQVLNDGFNGVVIGTELIRQVNRSPRHLASFLKEVDEVKHDSSL
ncbi:MAG: tryptophan synthase subunit alpha [Sphaerochaeta sp.]|nr:tryptophan synthase subunit alpha [Sphaerochaeta sp.]